MMKIGLIGCGAVANGHMRAYHNINNAKVIAVSDINTKKAVNFAAKHGINQVFSDYTELLELKDLDFVDICTPTSTHFRVVCDAAKSGHNILMEKPMALSTSECDEMIRETEKSGVKLCVCHNQLFYRSVRQAKAMVDSGYYDLVSFRTFQKGSPELIEAPQWNVSPKENGILWEVGCHLAYLQLYFLKDITEVYSLGSKAKHQVYDNFRVLLRTPNRSCGIIDVSWISRELEVSYEIESADGKRAIIDRDSDSMIEKTGEPNGGLLPLVKSVIQRFVPPPKTLQTEMRYYIGHYYLIREFIKSLNDDSPPPVRPQDGRRAIELLEHIKESLDKHKVTSLR